MSLGMSGRFSTEGLAEKKRSTLNMGRAVLCGQGPRPQGRGSWEPGLSLLPYCRGSCHCCNRESSCGIFCPSCHIATDFSFSSWIIFMHARVWLCVCICFLISVCLCECVCDFSIPVYLLMNSWVESWLSTVGVNQELRQFFCVHFICFVWMPNTRVVALYMMLLACCKSMCCFQL